MSYARFRPFLMASGRTEIFCSKIASPTLYSGKS
jgi:hypothetical protein